MEKRIPWDGLPGPLKAAIAERTGPVTAGRAVTDGQNSPLAAVIDTPSGKVFVKGLPSGHRLVITQAREAAAAPLVKGISPELLWHFDEAGWNVLGFEHVHGRAADYSPGSPDIDLVTGLMRALAAIEIPSGPGPWKPIETRLRTYVDTPADALAFAGRALTHTDWMPDNSGIATPWWGSDLVRDSLLLVGPLLVGFRIASAIELLVFLLQAQPYEKRHLVELPACNALRPRVI